MHLETVGQIPTALIIFGFERASIERASFRFAYITNIWTNYNSPNQSWTNRNNVIQIWV